MKELNLQEIRQQLDVIDASLTELFETRMELCREVAEYKIQTGKPVYDREREQQKLKAVTALAHIVCYWRASRKFPKKDGMCAA